MLYTNYYGCCRLFQTSKHCKVPHLKSTDLNRIQVTTLTCCNIQAKQHSCTMLATATDNCDVTNVTQVLCRHVNCLSRVLDVPAPTPVTTSDRYVPHHRCRSKRIFGGAKDFCSNFPKLAQKVVMQILPTVFWCGLQKMVFTCFSANVGRHI